MRRATPDLTPRAAARPFPPTPAVLHSQETNDERSRNLLLQAQRLLIVADSSCGPRLALTGCRRRAGSGLWNGRRVVMKARVALLGVVLCLAALPAGAGDDR